MMIRAIGMLFTGSMLLSACATPETRLRNGLQSIGLSKPLAGCMAGRMADRLSLGQLNKLNKLGKLRSKDPGDISFNEFVKHTRALQDPEIVSIVTSSGAICVIRSPADEK